MAGRPGEVSARRAARILGVHPKTVRTWCRKARKGERSPLPSGSVRRTPGERPTYFLDVSVLQKVLGDVE